MGLDFDNDGPLYASMEDVISALEAASCDYLVHTTMKATPNHHRLRALVPLSRPLMREEIRTCWDAVCRMFSGLQPDPRCKDLSRIYVAPARWQPRADGNMDPLNQFDFRINGDVLDIDAVLADYPPPPEPEPPVAMMPAMAKSVEVDEARRRPSRKPLPVGSIYTSPVVTAGMIEAYVNAPKGSHHTELYRFMTCVAGRAAAKGYDITVDDLISLAREVDQASPIRTNPNRWSRIRYEAERALRFAAKP